MNQNYKPIVEKAVELGAAEAKLLPTDQIVFDPRSFLKCRFGCNRWGKFWTCPPNLHVSPAEFMESFALYNTAVIMKTHDPKVGQEVAVAIEKEAMLGFDCQYAFALAMCVQCDECAYPDPCRYPHLARPSMDGYGVDIAKTLEPLEFNVEFDKEGKFIPVWYVMVLLD